MKGRKPQGGSESSYALWVLLLNVGLQAKQPENKASETLQSTEPQQEANHVKPKISPLQGILKKDKPKQENPASSLSIKKVQFGEDKVRKYSPQNPPSWTNRVTAKGKSGDLEKSR